jgi:DNA-binding NtrC family response regulator
MGGMIINYPMEKLEEKTNSRLIGRNLNSNLMMLVAKYANADASVLISGETGTGKGLVAEEIHKKSPRCNGPYVEVLTTTIPESLLESELLGYEKGAFTGADARKTGLLEQADNGTLFLDEIGELPPVLQAKLLYILEKKKFRRLGGKEEYNVDARIITASNRDFKKQLAEGKMRADLYYRLNVLRLSLPPLRERGDDIVELAEFFSARPELSCVITDDAKIFLLRQSWTGNVRELENTITRACLLADDNIITENVLKTISEDNQASEIINAEDLLNLGGMTYRQKMHDLKKRVIVRALEKTGYSQTQAAELLGMYRSDLYQLMKNYGIENIKNRKKE